MESSIDRAMYIRLKKRKKIVSTIMLTMSYVLLISGSLFISIPFIWMCITSIKDKGSVFTYPPEWIPRSTLMTVYSNKEYKIQETEIKGKQTMFIELESAKTIPAEVHTKIRRINPDPHVLCEIKLLEKNKDFIAAEYLRKELLEPTDEMAPYLNNEYPVYILKKSYEEMPKGLKVLIVSEKSYKYSVQPESIEVSQEYEDGEEEVYDEYEKKDLTVIRVSTPEIDGGKPFLAAKIDTKIFKPATWKSTVLAVQESARTKATIQYVDPDFPDELTGLDEVIAYEGDELKESGEEAEDNNGELKDLYFLESAPDLQFAIFKTEAIGYEPAGTPLSGITKYKPARKDKSINLKTFGPDERGYVTNLIRFYARDRVVDDDEEIRLSRIAADNSLSKAKVQNIRDKILQTINRPVAWQSENYFKDKKVVKAHWGNYKKALFEAIPAIKEENVDTFNILTVLLSIFKSIPAFVVYFINSIIMAVSVTFLSLMTSCFAAYSFSRLKWKGRDALFLLYLSTMMIPGTVTMIPVFIVIKLLGWIDSYKALILPLSFSAFAVFLLRQFFLSIPLSLEEAAELDGSTKLGVLFRVILPLSKPALATLTIFQFQGIYNEFMWPLIVTNSDHMKVVQIGLESFQGLHNTDWTLLMAATVIVVVPVLVVYIFNQKYINEGIKMGGIKG